MHFSELTINRSDDAWEHPDDEGAEKVDVALDIIGSVASACRIT